MKKTANLNWLRRFLFTLFIISIINSCIDPISIKIEGGDGVLVVDGLITDQAGPYVVKLSRSISYNTDQTVKVYSVPERNAKLVIADNHGGSELLTETRPGEYRTTQIQGIIGNIYTLSIETSDGEHYQSKEEKLLAVPEITKLESEYHVQEQLITNSNGDSKAFRIESFNIYVIVNDPPETGNNYRWQVDGIFEFFSLTDVPEIKQCWAPLTRLESKLEIAADGAFNGNSFRQLIAITTYDRPTDFLAKVRQQSLTKEAYTFWENLRNQQVNTGSIFDPPPTPVSGNVKNVSSETEVVLGYFGASAIAYKNILIDRLKDSGFSDPVRGVAIKPGDCRFHEPGATNVKPDGF
jgi:hypothetical protein